MKSETQQAIQNCLKFKGGRSRPDKSFPFILPLLENESGKILDVGCGRGSAPIIITAEYGTDKFTFTGVEIHADYVDASIYNSVFFGDYTKLYKEIARHDIYLFIDVLEHMYKWDAVRVVEHVQSMGAVIAAIPNAPKHWHQSLEFEAANPHEAHLYNWTNEEVKRDLGLRLVGENDGVGVFAYAI